MKKISAFALTLALPVVTAPAIAGVPPPPEGKSDILHCGCTIDEYTGWAQLTWSVLQVSNKSAKGHSKHEAGDEEWCPNALGESYEFTRGYNDCVLQGAIALSTNCWDDYWFGYWAAGTPCDVD